jgi:excisionase family DNA binding protein
MQPLLTVEELAQFLQIHPETARRLTREGKIPHLQVGGAYRYDRAAVSAYLAPPPPDHLQKYFDLVLRLWGSEGETGNAYKIAHFDGVSALARDLGLVTPKKCEEWRQEIRRATGAGA